MKRILVCIAVLSLVSEAYANGPAESPLSPEATLRAWGATLKSADLDRMCNFYASSENTVLILSWGKKRNGPQEVREEYEAAFKEVVFERVSFEDLSVHQSGDVAWACSKFTADTKRKSDQTGWTLQIRTTFVLKRSEKGWKIVLEHSSPIAGVPRAQRRP